MSLTAENSLGLIFFPAFDWAISPTHPEREERLLYTKDQIEEEGIFDINEIKEYNPELASLEDVNRTEICIPTAEKIVSKPHLISAGGAIKAGKLVMEGKTDKAFAIIRPPGHHAFQVVHGSRGFCTINNEAIMVEYLRQHYDPNLKIAFVDTDAHHADGTQNIYYNDPNVLHISLHQDGRTLFPGTGATDELGWPGGWGTTINLPLPPGTSDQGLHYALDNLVLPILNDFNPDLIINSAGQDNHFSDPLTNMQITAQGYAELNQKLDPDIAILQGGYSIESALPYTNVGIILAMAGIDYSGIQESNYTPDINQQANKVNNQIKKRIDYLLTQWHKKNDIDKQKKFDTDYYTTQQNIFYDTDQLQDNEQIKIKICHQCPGFVLISSTVSPKQFQTAKVLIIPQQSCSDCQQLAYDKYEQLKSDKEAVYLLDKAKNKLLKKI